MRAIVLLLTTLVLLPATAPAASAYEPVRIVHSERVQVGPYRLTVGFSTWPVRAMQALDFSFVPDGGIAGLSGTVLVVPPDGDGEGAEPLARHPRRRDVWGFDIRALDRPGDWTIRFALDGPRGRGEGTLEHLTVAEQPGPPLPLSWSVSVLPLVGLVVFLAVASRRSRAGPSGEVVGS